MGVLRARNSHPPHDADPRRVDGLPDAVQLGHDRPTQGHPASAARWTRRRARRAVHGPFPRDLRVRPRHGLPVAGADVPRCTARLLDRGAPRRRDAGDHGEVRCCELPGQHRTSPGHPQPVRAHDVHPHAQTPGRGAARARPGNAAGRHPRRGAVPGRNQAAHDRLVGPDHLGVLRGERGQWRHDHQQRGVAHQAGLRGPGQPGQGPHLR